MKAKYLGLDLSSPVVVSSSPYTATVANIGQCVANGAGAVVLKSIFEEQIIRHAAALDYPSQGMGDSGEYLERYLGDAYKGEFLKLVSDARTTGVPVIASINCIAADDGWTDYAVAMEAAGAAALELNIFLQPTDRHRTAQELEQDYADVVRRVAAAVKIPVSVKLPMRLTNVLAVADSLLARGARGVVLFNRFFEPDIDASINCIAADDGWTDYAVAMEAAGAAALELNIFLQPTDRHRTAQELEQDYADVVRRVAAAVKIPVSVKLPMRLTNVLAVADSLLARGARGVVLFNRFFEPDIDVERMAFVNGNPFSEPAELRNVLRSVALCSTALPQLDVAVSTGVHDGEAAVKALLCGANAVQVCSAIHEKGFGVIADINRFIEQWAERHGFESLGEFRGRMDYGNAESDVYQRVQYMKYFPHDAE